MTILQLLQKLRLWAFHLPVRVEIDGVQGKIEAVEYFTDHNEGFVVIRATADPVE